MSTYLTRDLAAFRRRLLAEPGITPRPVCGACRREVEPRDFGREYCQPCEAERAEVSAYWQAQIEATQADEPVPPSEPMFDSEDAAKPFLPEDEGSPA